MRTREILFRGKRLDNGVWVEGYLWTGSNFTCITPHNIGISYDDDSKRVVAFANEVDSKAVCQYIGMNDENDKKIFEGDICIIRSSSIDEEDGYFVVKWDNEESRFSLDGDGITVDFGSYYTHEIEVIGNIYDNPELLN